MSGPVFGSAVGRTPAQRTAALPHVPEVLQLSTGLRVGPRVLSGQGR